MVDLRIIAQRRSERQVTFPECWAKIFPELDRSLQNYFWRCYVSWGILVAGVQKPSFPGSSAITHRAQLESHDDIPLANVPL